MITIKKKLFKKNIVSIDNSIEDCIRLLQNLKEKIIFITKKNKFYGSITDNDLRKFYLNLKKKENISNLEILVNKKPFFLKKSKLKNYDPNYLKKKINKFFYVPIVDNQNKIIEIAISTNKTGALYKKGVNAIIMAGGYGKRLWPITKTMPKPNIVINKNSNLISIMDNFHRANVKSLFITTHYLSKLIKKEIDMFWLKESKIKFYYEKKQLGTFGSVIDIIKKNNLIDPIIVCNSDIVTNLNFANLIEYFYLGKCKFLVCSKIIKNSIPYGVIQTNKNNKSIKYLEEKPTEYKLINAGIYMVDPKIILKYFSNIKEINAIEVINKLLKNKVKCEIFPIKEFWSDMGTHEQLEILKKIGKD